MADKELRFIIDWLGRLVEYTFLLVFIPNEKRWGEYNRSQRQFRMSTIGIIPLQNIRTLRAICAPNGTFCL